VERRIQATLAMVGTAVGCILCGLFLFHFEIVRFMQTKIQQPNKRGAGKGGFAVLWRAGRAWPALPDRERYAVALST
jgi:hypothetical protein